MSLPFNGLPVLMQAKPSGYEYVDVDPDDSVIHGQGTPVVLTSSVQPWSIPELTQTRFPDIHDGLKIDITFENASIWQQVDFTSLGGEFSFLFYGQEFRGPIFWLSYSGLISLSQSQPSGSVFFDAKSVNFPMWDQDYQLILGYGSTAFIKPNGTALYVKLINPTDPTRRILAIEWFNFTGSGDFGTDEVITFQVNIHDQLHAERPNQILVQIIDHFAIVFEGLVGSQNLNLSPDPQSQLVTGREFVTVLQKSFEFKPPGAQPPYPTYNIGVPQYRFVVAKQNDSHFIYYNNGQNDRTQFETFVVTDDSQQARLTTQIFQTLDHPTASVALIAIYVREQDETIPSEPTFSWSPALTQLGLTYFAGMAGCFVPSSPLTYLAGTIFPLCVTYQGLDRNPNSEVKPEYPDFAVLYMFRLFTDPFGFNSVYEIVNAFVLTCVTSDTVNRLEVASMQFRQVPNSVSVEAQYEVILCGTFQGRVTTQGGPEPILDEFRQFGAIPSVLNTLNLSSDTPAGFLLRFTALAERDPSLDYNPWSVDTPVLIRSAIIDPLENKEYYSYLLSGRFTSEDEQQLHPHHDDHPEPYHVTPWSGGLQMTSVSRSDLSSSTVICTGYYVGGVTVDFAPQCTLQSQDEHLRFVPFVLAVDISDRLFPLWSRGGGNDNAINTSLGHGDDGHVQRLPYLAAETTADGLNAWVGLNYTHPFDSTLTVIQSMGQQVPFLSPSLTTPILLQFELGTGVLSFHRALNEHQSVLEGREAPLGHMYQSGFQWLQLAINAQLSTQDVPPPLPVFPLPDSGLVYPPGPYGMNYGDVLGPSTLPFAGGRTASQGLGGGAGIFWNGVWKDTLLTLDSVWQLRDGSNVNRPFGEPGASYRLFLGSNCSLWCTPACFDQLNSLSSLSTEYLGRVFIAGAEFEDANHGTPEFGSEISADLTAFGNNPEIQLGVASKPNTGIISDFGLSLLLQYNFSGVLPFILIVDLFSMQWCWYQIGDRGNAGLRVAIDAFLQNEQPVAAIPSANIVFIDNDSKETIFETGQITSFTDLASTFVNSQGQASLVGREDIETFSSFADWIPLPTRTHFPFIGNALKQFDPVSNPDTVVPLSYGTRQQAPVLYASTSFYTPGRQVGPGQLFYSHENNSLGEYLFNPRTVDSNVLATGLGGNGLGLAGQGLSLQGGFIA